LARALLAGLLLTLCCAALAQDKMEPAAPTGEARPEAPKAPEEKAKGKKEPVLEIKRTGPPECQVKPVMTDAEIETCKRAARAPHG